MEDAVARVVSESEIEDATFKDCMVEVIPAARYKWGQESCDQLERAYRENIRNGKSLRGPNRISVTEVWSGARMMETDRLEENMARMSGPPSEAYKAVAASLSSERGRTLKDDDLKTNGAVAAYTNENRLVFGYAPGSLALPVAAATVVGTGSYLEGLPSAVNDTADAWVKQRVEKSRDLRVRLRSLSPDGPAADVGIDDVADLDLEDGSEADSPSLAMS